MLMTGDFDCDRHKNVCQNFYRTLAFIILLVQCVFVLFCYPVDAWKLIDKYYPTFDCNMQVKQKCFPQGADPINSYTQPAACNFNPLNQHTLHQSAQLFSC